ncbi:hypothetical protein [Gorillibacterium sp. CAU 1737]|uniref:hypothetical protein n=1 Tax=Gorillibacterium sp. CAU 1737 TaxID=3140362 RepID=UPI0032607EB3
MTEKSVIAYFASREAAEEAVNKLRALRALDARVDSFGRFPGSSEGSSTPISGDISSLSSLTLNATVETRDTGILLAADPSASGLSGDPSSVSGHRFVLSAVVPEETHHQALRAVEQSGGTL